MEQEKEAALADLQHKLDNMETDYEKILHVSVGTAGRDGGTEPNKTNRYTPQLDAFTFICSALNHNQKAFQSALCSQRKGATGPPERARKQEKLPCGKNPGADPSTGPMTS